jgi:hypothetical protein
MINTHLSSQLILIDPEIFSEEEIKQSLDAHLSQWIWVIIACVLKQRLLAAAAVLKLL